MSALPRIAVIGTGGTISSLGADSLDVLDYTDTNLRLEADELVARFPECAAVADVVAIRAARRLRRAARHLRDAGAAAVDVPSSPEAVAIAEAVAGVLETRAVRDGREPAVIGVAAGGERQGCHCCAPHDNSRQYRTHGVQYSAGRGGTSFGAAIATQKVAL